MVAKAHQWSVSAFYEDGSQFEETQYFDHKNVITDLVFVDTDVLSPKPSFTDDGGRWLDSISIPVTGTTVANLATSDLEVSFRTDTKRKLIDLEALLRARWEYKNHFTKYHTGCKIHHIPVREEIGIYVILVDALGNTRRFDFSWADIQKSLIN